MHIVRSSILIVDFFFVTFCTTSSIVDCIGFFIRVPKENFLHCLGWYIAEIAVLIVRSNILIAKKVSEYNFRIILDGTNVVHLGSVTIRIVQSGTLKILYYFASVRI